jgi:16S rRNA (guanine527-N7)-methyltransferase
MSAPLTPLGSGWGALIARAAEAFGANIEPKATDALVAWLDLVATWNARIDLTAARSADELVDLMLADAIVIAPELAPGTRIVDVGSGAGAPGLAIGLLRPDVSVTLAEPLQKRVAFLRTVLGTVACTNVEVVRERAEDLAAPFDAAISRATFAPAEWLEIATRIAAPEGSIWVLVTRDFPPMRADWRPASGRVYRWPLTGADRSAFCYRRRPA